MKKQSTLVKVDHSNLVIRKKAESFNFLSMNLSEAMSKVLNLLKLLKYLMEMLCFKLPDDRYKPIAHHSESKNRLLDNNELDNLTAI